MIDVPSQCVSCGRLVTSCALPAMCPECKMEAMRKILAENRIEELEAELAEARRLIAGLSERVAAQSELLSKRAESPRVQELLDWLRMFEWFGDERTPQECLVCGAGREQGHRETCRLKACLEKT